MKALCMLLVSALAAGDAFTQPCETLWSNEFADSSVEGGVDRLCLFDRGRGEEVIAAGEFTVAGEACELAAWDGNRFRPVPHDLQFETPGPAFFSLAAHSAAGEDWLYVCGTIDAVSGEPARNIARWNGSTWEAVGVGEDEWIFGLRVLDLGAGPQLFGAGQVQLDPAPGGETAAQLFLFEGRGWHRYGPPLPIPGGVDHGRFNDVVVGEEDGRPVLYASGRLKIGESGGLAALRDGVWEALNADFRGDVLSIEWVDMGAGGQLLIGGRNIRAEGRSVAFAVWDGVKLELPSDVELIDEVQRVLVADGPAPVVTVVGNFEALSRTLRNVAQWDGTEWKPLGTGLSGNVLDGVAVPGSDGRDIIVSLVSGGYGRGAGCGTVEAAPLALWSEQRWQTLWFGVGLGSPYATREFIVLGPRHIDGIPGDGVYLRVDERWAPLPPISGACGAFAAIWEGSGVGRRLLVGGGFHFSTSGVIEHDGSEWVSVGSDLDGSVWSLEAGHFRGRDALFAGGSFTYGSGRSTRRIAELVDGVWQELGRNGIQDTVTQMRIYGQRGVELLAMVAAPPGHRLCLYDGEAVHHMGWTNGPICELAPVYLNGEPHLLMFGEFTTFDDEPADGIVCLDASGQIVEPPFTRPPNLLKIEAAHVEFTPGGPLVYLAGPSARTVGAYGYARYWHGEWRAFQDECDGPIDSIRVHHHEAGSDLWLLGRFGKIADTSALGFARRPACSLFCSADFDLDGELTFFDFLQFQELFAASDPVADLDRDGNFTFFDFLAFQSEFAMGCP